ncbi:MAG: carbon starvation CstA family protein [Planctomycetota bacterium]
MSVLLIAILAGVGFVVAYHTYGRWLGSRIFELSANAVCPAVSENDGRDFVPTSKPIVFGHHFTSIAGTGPIVGPAIAVIWGWGPALLWVVFGSIFIGAVHDFGSLVVSLRNRGQTVGDIAGRVINRRVRVLFLLVLFMALTIVLAIFGLVIANVLKLYPAAITPVLLQVPLAVAIGVWLHRRGADLKLPSILALAIMYATVLFGDVGTLSAVNAWFASWPTIVWVFVLLGYGYVASVLPVWVLLQPRDFINALQLLTALGLVVVGLFVAAIAGGASPAEGVPGQPLDIAAPFFRSDVPGAPMSWLPLLFITVACGAISGFHCLVSSGTSSKQLKVETDAKFVGFGAMLTEGFLATIVILACIAGLGLGITKTQELQVVSGSVPGNAMAISAEGELLESVAGEGLVAGQIRETHGVWDGLNENGTELTTTWTGASAYGVRYGSWAAADGLAAKVGAFVDGAANFLKALGLPGGVAVALMGVLVASFAGTTLDTACRLQRYVIQELAACFVRTHGPGYCAACGYDLRGNESGTCPECGVGVEQPMGGIRALRRGSSLNPLRWLMHPHAAALFAVVVAGVLACLPVPGSTAMPDGCTLWHCLTPGATITTLGEGGRPSHLGHHVMKGGLEAGWLWLTHYAGKGGLILWPMFGATNQLLGGLAFLVIGFWLWRRGKPVWFLIVPMAFMLVMPAWALLAQLPAWWNATDPNWVLIGIALATLALELWMVTEAVLLWPKVRGILEEAA